MKPKLKTTQQLEKQCAAWNAKYPIGTRVKFYGVIHNKREDREGIIFTTCSLAQVLGGHTAVVWLDQYVGCVALDALKPFEAGEEI